MVAMVVPTATVSRGAARVAFSTPAAGASTSASTLSVSTTQIGSSRSTRSPACLSHCTMVASSMLWPHFGRGTAISLMTRDGTAPSATPSGQVVDQAAAGLARRTQGLRVRRERQLLDVEVDDGADVRPVAGDRLRVAGEARLGALHAAERGGEGVDPSDSHVPILACAEACGHPSPG